MQGATASLLTAWANFYVIIGSATAALTGLMFVVITLSAGLPQARRGEGIAAFGTPTVVHFCAALLITAILSAPWQTFSNAGPPLLLGLISLGGILYVIIVTQRTRHQAGYTPVLEDWLWHVIFPLVSYIAFLVAAIMLLSNPAPALFVIGSATMLLLFIGIHNAWDGVTYIAIERFKTENKSQD